MTPAEGIRRLGFRRWYERQLLESHAWFVTCFLSMLVVAVCLEQIDWRQPLREAAPVAYLVVGVLAGLVSLQRYSRILSQAESLGGQSTCARCSTYGVLTVLGSAERSEDAPDSGWIYVKCSNCGHEWRLDAGKPRV